MSKKQKNSENKMYIALSFGLIAFAYFGFRFVTQAGQGGVVVQNDGYAMVGGTMIFVAGILLGYIYGKRGRW